MSKKSSAASKGYREYRPTKKTMSEREKRTMIIGLIAFFVIVIGVVVGVKIYEDRGLLKVKDNVIQGVEDTWIVKNTGTNTEPRVFKMAEMTAPLEGYTLDAPDRNIMQTQFSFYNADDEDAPVEQYYVGVANGNYDEAPENTYSAMASFGTIIDRSEITYDEIAGIKVGYYSQSYSMDQSEAQDGSDVHYYQYLNAYFESNFKGYSILISVGGEVDNEDSMVSDEELLNVLEAAAANLVISPR